MDVVLFVKQAFVVKSQGQSEMILMTSSGLLVRHQTTEDIIQLDLFTQAELNASWLVNQHSCSHLGECVSHACINVVSSHVFVCELPWDCTGLMEYISVLLL